MGRRNRSTRLQPIELLDGPREEELDATVKMMKAFLKDARFSSSGPCDRRRIRNAPVRGHRLPRPHRTRLGRGLVTNREHESSFGASGPAGRGPGLPPAPPSPQRSPLSPQMQLSLLASSRRIWTRAGCPTALHRAASSSSACRPSTGRRSGCCGPCHRIVTTLRVQSRAASQPRASTPATRHGPRPARLPRGRGQRDIDEVGVGIGEDGVHAREE